MPDGLAVNGVDMAMLLARFSGDGSVLLDVLRSYSSGTRPLLNSLKEFLESENLPEYAVTVHGVKGSSYGIAAREAGKAAEALEISAKAGDLPAVRAGHPALESLITALLDDIDAALDSLESAHDRPPAQAPDPALLKELREACAAFEMDRVDSLMERLEAFRYETGGELVTWLREKVDGMAFEEITGAKELDANGD